MLDGISARAVAQRPPALHVEEASSKPACAERADASVSDAAESLDSLVAPLRKGLRNKSSHQQKH
jgi:hypothetical protein